MATNREFFSGRTLDDTLRHYRNDVAKGFNKGLEEWLDFPYFKAEYTNRNGATYMKGKEYKGKFYTPEEFKRYQKGGCCLVLLPPRPYHGNTKEMPDMGGSIRLDVLAKKDQNYVNGVCDFCGGDRFASHILVIRPQKGLVINQKEHEIKFCDECFSQLQTVINNAIKRTE